MFLAFSPGAVARKNCDFNCFLLFATLIGSIFNIPIAELPSERAMSHPIVLATARQFSKPDCWTAALS